MIDKYVHGAILLVIDSGLIIGFIRLLGRNFYFDAEARQIWDGFMKYDKAYAADWMNRMYRACMHSGALLHGGAYSGKENHLKFARETGYSLTDFDEQAQQEILKCSYSVIYVRACDLKPLLNAKQWIAEMKKGFAKACEKYGRING